MSATPPGISGDGLDQDTPDTIRLSVAEATALGKVRSGVWAYLTTRCASSLTN